MREILNLCEGKSLTIDDIPTSVVKAGTKLWHGTDCGGDFQCPDGPAWFAFTFEIAQKWSGWCEGTATGRTKGARRVLAFEVKSDLTLLLVDNEAHWYELSEIATGEADGSPWTMAAAIANKNLAKGWVGTGISAEIMLTDPTNDLIAKGCAWSEDIDLVESQVLRKDAADEDDRVFLAYCKKHKIKASTLNNEELHRKYAEAIANRDQYPIPISDPKFLYHGTARINLSKITLNGLQPSEKTNGRALAAHSLGRVFFTETISNALFYALRASGYGKTQALLRVHRDAVNDAQPDGEDSGGSVFVERPVPADQIEVWNGRKWIPILHK